MSVAQRSHDAMHPRWIGVPSVVRGRDDLAALLEASRSRRRMPRGQITLTIPGMDDAARLAAQRRLNVYAHACGCGAGGISALAALAFGLLWTLQAQVDGSVIALAEHVLATLAMAVVAGGAGKIAGLEFARRRFRRTCAALLAKT